MRLADYMALKGLSDKDIAAQVGRDRSYVNRLRRGTHVPTLELARKVQQVTRGKVTLMDWAEAAE